MQTTKSYINGAISKSEGNQTFSNINPATGLEIGHVHFATADDVERAVYSAQEGFRIWSNTSP